MHAEFRFDHLSVPKILCLFWKLLVLDLWSSGQTTEMYLDKAFSGMVKREIIIRLAADMDQKQMELTELAEIQKNNAKMINKKYKDQ